MDISINKLDTKEKKLFLTLTIVNTILITSISSFILLQLNHIFQRSSLIFILTLLILCFIAIFLFGILNFLFIAFYEKKSFFLRKLSRFIIHLIFPLNIILGKFFFIKKDKVRESFIAVNNALGKAFLSKISAENILILLPHCLQHVSCNLRITNNINNCIECGKCDIALLKRLSEKYNVTIAVATGGTLARRIIKEKKPQIVLAVACHRDLVSGILDIFPIQVFGFLNETPEGPCINTKVFVPTLENTLGSILK